MDELYEYYKLNEFLNHTLDIEKAIKNIHTDLFLINKNMLYDSDVVFDIDGKKLIINFLNKNYKVDDLKKIISSILSTGYFVSQYFLSTNKIENYLIIDDNMFFKEFSNKDIIKFELICEPKFLDNIVNLENKIYHISNEIYKNDILYNGLCPKCSKRKKSYHPERIYFCTNKKDIQQMLNSIKFIDMMNTKNVKDYIVFEIDTKNLKTNNFSGDVVDVVFYKDPNSDGVYTYENISPKNIKVYNS